MLKALARSNFERDVAGIDRQAAKRMNWTIVEDGFPILDIIFSHATAKSIRLRFNCSDWDEVPPEIELLEADGSPIKTMPADPKSIFNRGPNPSTGRPFICMRGSRHYHQLHPEDRWENHRGKAGMELGGILFQLWRVWSRIAT